MATPLSRPERIRAAVALWIIAAVATVVSLPAPFLVPIGMLGFPPAILWFTFLGAGLGVLGFSLARDGAIKPSFYLPVLVGLAASLVTGALYFTVYVVPPSSACLGSQANCAPFIVAHIAAVAAVGLLTVAALVWLGFVVVRRRRGSPAP